MDGECRCVILTHRATGYVRSLSTLRDVLICLSKLACQPIAVLVSEVVVAESVCAPAAHHERHRVEHTHARARGSEILKMTETVSISEDETESIPEERTVSWTLWVAVGLAVDGKEWKNMAVDGKNMLQLTVLDMYACVDIRTYISSCKHISCSIVQSCRTCIDSYQRCTVSMFALSLTHAHTNTNLSFLDLQARPSIPGPLLALRLL